MPFLSTGTLYIVHIFADKALYIDQINWNSAKTNSLLKRIITVIAGE